MDSGDVKVKLMDLTPKPVSDILCLFCRKKSENKLTKINDKKEILSALKLLVVEYEALVDVEDHICYQCVYRVNLIVDYRRILQRNINKSRANYFFNQGNKEMCNKYLNHIKPEKNTSSPPSNEKRQSFETERQLVVPGIRPERYDRTDNINDLQFDCFVDIRSNSTHSIDNHSTANSSTNSPSKLLEPLYEKSESVLATESGGSANDYSRLFTKSYDLYKCNYCSKVYKRKTFLVKHIRKHTYQQRRKRSASQDPAKFECKLCDGKFSTKHRYESHLKSHSIQYECTFCDAQYKTIKDLEWHLAVCSGKKRAEHDDDGATPPPLTRSQRNGGMVDSESMLEDDDYEDEGSDSMYNERLRKCDTWLTAAPSEYTTDDETKSLFSSCSFATSFSRATSVLTEDIESIGYITDGATEMGSTITGYSKSRFDDDQTGPTTRSVSEKIRKINRRLEDRNSNRTRSRKKGKRFRGIEDYEILYHCPECNYTSYDFHRIMKHDVDHHFKLPLFRCEICRQQFTRDEFLQRHLAANHASAAYKCPLCAELLMFKHELKHHIELHQIRSHPCQICQMSFLKEGQLNEHVKITQHFQEDAKKQVEIIERLRYILDDENETPPENDQSVYSPKELIQKTMDLERNCKYENFRWKFGYIDYVKLNILESQNVATVLEDSTRFDEEPVEEEMSQESNYELANMDIECQENVDNYQGDIQLRLKNVMDAHFNSIEFDTDGSVVNIFKKNSNNSNEQENISIENDQNFNTEDLMPPTADNPDLDLELFSVTILDSLLPLDEQQPEIDSDANEEHDNRKRNIDNNVEIENGEVNEKVRKFVTNEQSLNERFGGEAKDTKSEKSKKPDVKHRLVLPKSRRLLPSYTTLFTPISISQRPRLSVGYDGPHTSSSFKHDCS